MPPCKFLPIVIVFFILSLNFDKQTNLGYYFLKINNSFATIFVFWFMHQLLIPFSIFFNKLEKTLSKALVAWIVNSLKYLIIFLGVAALLETWGIKVGPVIAGLGLLGVAVALGAQDLFKNLISGIMILMEKRFQIGDVIKVPGHTEGVVEQIGFRSTLIRKFDSTPITIPNYIFAEAPILNYTNRNYRRVNWTIEEAANLVLNTTKISKGGEIFLLDMGKPIKLYDLAKFMIQFSGKTIKKNGYGDVDIKIIGLREGEKLYEELLIDEKSAESSVKYIYQSLESKISNKNFQEIYSNILNSYKSNNIKSLKKTLIGKFINYV